jgi:hypothetical protein
MSPHGRYPCGRTLNVLAATVLEYLLASRLNPAGIAFVQFYFQETGVFDAWLDDVAFVRDP